MQQLDELAQRQMQRHAKAREETRAKFPIVTGWCDILNAAGLGPVSLKFAEEGGNRAGKESA